MSLVYCYMVHIYTASGIFLGALSIQSVIKSDYKAAFFWLFLATLVDATDGPLARYFKVKDFLPQIDGRKLDDIIDYLNYTFIPVLLLWHGDWLPAPSAIFVALPLITSLFGFSSVKAKEETAGFFGGFPSYWNIVTFYEAVWLGDFGPHIVGLLVVILSLATLLPIRFVYPSLAKKWRGFFIYGGGAWGLTILVMLFF